VVTNRPRKRGQGSPMPVVATQGRLGLFSPG
jgi:hypothetical protein